MNWLGRIFGSAVFSGISTVLAPILGYFTSKDTLEEKGFEIGAATDAKVQMAYIDAQLQAQQLKASVNTWWGARLIILVVAGAAAYHFSAVMFDSVPWFGHVVGSWRVPKLPEPYDTYEGQILLSFFILTPAAPVFSAMASWLHRK